MQVADVLFTSYHVNYEYLEEWVGSRSVSSKFLRSDNNLSGIDISVNFSKPIDAYIPSLKGNLTIDTMYDTSQGIVAFELTISQYISVNRKEPTDLNWYL